MVTSPRIIFLVVGSLSVIVISGLGAMLYLIMNQIDAALIGIIASPVSIALGALISLLNNTRTQAAPAANPSPDPAPVVVTNQPSDPVPTIEKTHEKG